MYVTYSQDDGAPFIRLGEEWFIIHWHADNYSWVNLASNVSVWMVPGTVSPED